MEFLKSSVLSAQYIKICDIKLVIEYKILQAINDVRKMKIILLPSYLAILPNQYLQLFPIKILQTHHRCVGYVPKS